MASNTASADLLPAIETMRVDQRHEESLAHSLPHVALDRIALFVSDHSPTLLTLATFSEDLKDICRPYISKGYETLHNGERFLCHRALQLVLQGYLDPSYIYQIDCENATLDGGNVKRGTESYEDLKYRYDALRSAVDPERHRRHFSKLLREAVSRSAWIPLARQDEICEEVHIGDSDAALAVLLPLCTKLKTLEIPKHANHCAAVVQVISQAYRHRGITGPEARRTAWEAALRDRTAPTIRRCPAPDALPLSELLILYTEDRHWIGYWIPLANTIPFLGIPSLHRIILDVMRDREEDFPEWPAEYAACSCPEIWLHRSCITRRAIQAFAQGMADSCEIRQHLELDAHWTRGREQAELTWDSVLVRRREDGSKDVETRVAFDGGDPGFEHPWVSWMFWGKMQDWRRLDEEFSVQEGDDHLPELGAGL